MNLEKKNCDGDREKENAKIETINGMHNIIRTMHKPKSLNRNDTKKANGKKT